MSKNKVTNLFQDSWYLFTFWDKIVEGKKSLSFLHYEDEANEQWYSSFNSLYCICHASLRHKLHSLACLELLPWLVTCCNQQAVQSGSIEYLKSTILQILNRRSEGIFLLFSFEAPSESNVNGPKSLNFRSRIVCHNFHLLFCDQYTFHFLGHLVVRNYFSIYDLLFSTDI